jgi:hypothetical protein
MLKSLLAVARKILEAFDVEWTVEIAGNKDPYLATAGHRQKGNQRQTSLTLILFDLAGL